MYYKEKHITMCIYRNNFMILSNNKVRNTQTSLWCATIWVRSLILYIPIEAYKSETKSMNYCMSDFNEKKH